MLFSRGSVFDLCCRFFLMRLWARDLPSKKACEAFVAPQHDGSSSGAMFEAEGRVPREELRISRMRGAENEARLS